MSYPLRLALIADIHHGDFAETIDGPVALGLLEHCIGEINELQPDLVVDLGDRINNADHSTDHQLLSQVVERFRTLQVPHRHLLGNHDQIHLSREENEAMLGTTMKHQSLDVREWHLVFWFVASEAEQGSYLITGDDLEWLATDLAETSLPSVIFTHIPLGGGSLVGHHFFEDAPNLASYQNAAAARRVISASDRAVMAVSGHMHWNTLHTVDGIHYLTIQSLSETFTTHPKPAGAWALLEVDHDRADIRVKGNDCAGFSLPIRQPGHHWLRSKAEVGSQEEREQEQVPSKVSRPSS